MYLSWISYDSVHMTNETVKKEDKPPTSLTANTSLKEKVREKKQKTLLLPSLRHVKAIEVPHFPLIALMIGKNPSCSCHGLIDVSKSGLKERIFP